MLNGQDFAVFALVGLATLYLWRVWFGASQENGCGSCGGCESASQSDDLQLVQIDVSRKWTGKE